MESNVSLRDYFIARAPAEPQPWFTPVMPAQPDRVELPPDMTDEERNELKGWGDYYDTHELKCPRVRQFAERTLAYRIERAAWEEQFTKQRYLQWPAAWADGMMLARVQHGASAAQQMGDSGVPEALVNTLMEQVQVYASAWSLVGGPLDDGDGLERAEQEKRNLREMIAAGPALQLEQCN